MRKGIALTLVLSGLIASLPGCKKEIDTAEFKSAINNLFVPFLCPNIFLSAPQCNAESQPAA